MTELKKIPFKGTDIAYEKPCLYIEGVPGSNPICKESNQKPFAENLTEQLWLNLPERNWQITYLSWWPLYIIKLPLVSRTTWAQYFIQFNPESKMIRKIILFPEYQQDRLDFMISVFTDEQPAVIRAKSLFQSGDIKTLYDVQNELESLLAKYNIPFQKYLTERPDFEKE